MTVPGKASPEKATPETLDCRGQRCPLPVIGLARRLTDLPVGAVLRVLADDPAAAVDIPAWCRMRGHEYVGSVEADGATGYDVRRLA
jgi:tRNA 2-thiouridine synthesizing protein A